MRRQKLPMLSYVTIVCDGQGPKSKKRIKKRHIPGVPPFALYKIIEEADRLMVGRIEGHPLLVSHRLNGFEFISNSRG